jgi:hydroxyethylthiazole kinase
MKGNTDVNTNTIIDIINIIKSDRPLVHSITNPVVANFTANGLLALGASPVMANFKEEVCEITSKANALVLNLGMLNAEQLEAMLVAGKTANEFGIPIVLDPVGVAASSFRKEAATMILTSLNISVIRGNVAEIAALNNVKIEAKGVDALNHEGFSNIAIQTAKNFNCVIAATGKEDIVTNGFNHFTIKNGHPLLTKVTGTGCLLSSVIGAFLGVYHDSLTSSVAALTTYGIAAELAANTSENHGPGRFQVELLNELYRINKEQILHQSKYFSH